MTCCGPSPTVGVPLEGWCCGLSPTVGVPLEMTWLLAIVFVLVCFSIDVETFGFVVCFPAVGAISNGSEALMVGAAASAYLFGLLLGLSAGRGSDCTVVAAMGMLWMQICRSFSTFSSPLLTS